MVNGLPISRTSHRAMGRSSRKQEHTSRLEKPDNEKGIQSETFNPSNLITRDSMSSFLDRKRNVKKDKMIK